MLRIIKRAASAFFTPWVSLSSLARCAIAAVAIVTLIGGLAARALIKSGESRFRAANDRARNDCRAFRSTAGHEDADVCKDDEFAPSALKSFRSAQDYLDDANKAFAHDDVNKARADITSALAISTKLEIRGSTIDAIASADIVERALDLVDTHPREIQPMERTLLFMHTKMWAAKHPLESERVDRLYHLSEWSRVTPGFTRGINEVGDAIVADKMLEEDATLSEMQRALLARDDGRCQQAARAYGESPALCTRMARVIRTNARLDRESHEWFQDIMMAIPRKD